MLSRSTIFLGLMLTGTLALASFVREDESASSEVVQPTSNPKLQGVNASAYPTLQLEKLARTGLDDPEHNPFAGKSFSGSSAFPPVIPTLKDAEQPPSESSQSLNDSGQASTPGVPFRYMGRIQEEGGRPVVFFTQGSQAYAVSEGETIDDSYRLERVSPTQLVLVYLPLKTRQTIEIASLETEPETGADKAWSETHLTYHRELQMRDDSQGADRDGQ
jgi:hypothetical protein